MCVPPLTGFRRYRVAAQWLVKLIEQSDDAPLKLQRTISASSPSYDPQRARVEFDASPYGGAALLYDKGTLMEWFALDWEDIPRLQIKRGLSRHQTFWEFLTLTLAIVRWCPVVDGLLICGDNVASLQLALSHKGKGEIAAVSRELAWRVARGGWRYAVAHLPAEANVLADRLSRLSDPALPPLVHMPDELVGAAQVNARLSQLWSLPS